MPHLLGLTGNIASGKTTIGQMLLDLGAARYIDADAVVHDLYLPRQAIYEAITEAFGPRIVAPDQTIDRRALGAIVFADPAALSRLEAITHPAVHVAVAERLADLAPDEIAVIDAVKLLEGGMAAQCEAVWLVICRREEQLRRLLVDRGFSREEAEARLAAQPDNEPRRALVSAVINNSDTLDATHAQVTSAWGQFLSTLR